MIRFIDFILSFLGLIFLAPVILIIFIIGLFDTGSPFFIQTRLGKKQQPFSLIKFRSMRPDTASVGTHLVQADAITPLGRFLRKSKLDELPQLVNVLKGEMSLVGPRPGLPNQKELKTQRALHGVFSVRPGVTGLAQVNEVDMSTPRKLAKYDRVMIKRMTLMLYFKLIIATVLGQGGGDRVKS